ncbi:unnamed protein product [Arabidopsis halleri]
MHHGRELKEKAKEEEEKGGIIEIPNDGVLEEIMVRLPVKAYVR